MNNLWFIDSNTNDKFSKLSDNEIQELLNQLNKFYLTYRENLNLPNNVSFGVELEYQDVSNEIVQKYLNKYLDTWKYVDEPTLDNGGEINSPVMFDKKEYWQELKRMCRYLKRIKANVDDCASTHVHVGAHVLGDSVHYWRKFLKSYIVYESVLSRFFYGDKINPRKSMNEYATPISDILYSEIDELNKVSSVEEIGYIIPRRQFQTLDFRKVRFYDASKFRILNTLEFRAPNGTKEEIICQNNINTITKLLLSTKNQIDEELLDYKLSHKKEYFIHNNLNLKYALEFVDMVFNNNLDKSYFLRQYIKDNRINNNSDIPIYSKKFIK